MNSFFSVFLFFLPFQVREAKRCVIFISINYDGMKKQKKTNKNGLKIWTNAWYVEVIFNFNLIYDLVKHTMCFKNISTILEYNSKNKNVNFFWDHIYLIIVWNIYSLFVIENLSIKRNQRKTRNKEEKKWTREIKRAFASKNLDRRKRIYILLLSNKCVLQMNRLSKDNCHFHSSCTKCL